MMPGDLTNEISPGAQGCRAESHVDMNAARLLIFWLKGEPQAR